jgi:deoxyribose-phosphate aldolase
MKKPMRVNKEKNMLTAKSVKPEDIKRLVSVIDYSEALTIMATAKDVASAAADAVKYGFRAVVAHPQYVPQLVEAVKGSTTLPQLAVGFPSGGATIKVKCIEAEEGLASGARDLDMVMNIGAFKAGDFKKVSEDIIAVRKIADPYKIPFKVIIEVGVLTDEEIVNAAKLVKDAGATFVKTCTGFAVGRATLHIIRLIRETIGPDMGIKASGGVASIEDGLSLLDAGATVIALRRPIVDQLQKLNWKK